MGVSSYRMHSDKNFMKTLRSLLTFRVQISPSHSYIAFMFDYSSCVGHFQRIICGRSNIHTRDREVLREFDWLLVPAVARDSLAGLAY